jgi:hypothetical protein
MDDNDSSGVELPCALRTSPNNNDNLHPDLLRTSPDEGCVPTDLDTLACLVEAKAIEAIDWYLRRKKTPKRLAQWIRALAIILAVVGGAQPFLDGFDVLKGSGNWGFVFLGLSGALVLADKLFGFSSAWTRYITTQLKLQNLLAEFQMDWAIRCSEVTGNPTNEQRKEMLERLKKFRMDIWSAINEETQTWVTEFKSSLAQVAQRAEAQAETVRPASLRLSVENTSGVDNNNIEVFLDGNPCGTAKDGKAVIKDLRPGAYTVRAVGARQGNEVSASDTLAVTAGETAELTLRLP